ncbi:MAG TPA: FAD-dependent oxidoreductase [Thermoanaerobaculia bacterium]|nr:FAD-dependent oxidoreductase [Thermoanaerobaculia bacterium]
MLTSARTIMSSVVGTAEQPLRVAIVGTGPSGMYAAAALLAQPGLHVSVDLIDRLPAPFGLVRYGVAPDHQKIKNVNRVFDKTAQDSRVRFFGNVQLGRDLDRADLLRHYHQVVYAVGAQADRSMGVPGEELAGSYSSTEFVAWYNCHPDLADARFELGHESVAVVGIGNVAMDVARILATRAEELQKTDIGDHALEHLRVSGIREVWVLARRGPVQAKCSPPELKEISELEGVQVVVEPGELEVDPASAEELAADRAAQKNMEIFRELAAAPVDAEKVLIRFRFCVSPVEVLGRDGKVAGLRLERNRLESDGRGGTKALGTGEHEELPVTMVIRAIGYKSLPLVDLPYDARAGLVPNREGRIVDAQGNVLPGEYVVGWVKRGPTGLIGTNKPDAAETVQAMLADLPKAAPLPVDGADLGAVPTLLASRGARAVDYAEWRRLDAREVERGQPQGRPRVKFLRLEEMLLELGMDPASVGAAVEP